MNTTRRSENYQQKVMLERDLLIKNLSKFMKVEYSDLKKLDEELFNSDFMNYIHSQKKQVEGIKLGSLPYRTLAPILYLICRIKKPKVVVETGVASGFSSSFILKALQENSIGKLYSIDLPVKAWKENDPREYICRPNDRDVGWLVPNNLRDRWELIIGSSDEKLKPLLDRLQSVDIFLHDSDHHYKYMLWEYQTVWSYIRKGGLLLSDDIDRHEAFNEFTAKKNSSKLILSGQMGITIK